MQFAGLTNTRKQMGEKLDAGDIFPDLEVNVVGGGNLTEEEENAVKGKGRRQRWGSRTKQRRWK